MENRIVTEAPYDPYMDLPNYKFPTLNLLEDYDVMSRQTVPLIEVLGSSNFKNTKFDLPIAIGRTELTEYFVMDLAKMPHLLIAGATGQGKSVGLNTIITSLLYKKHPADLKFVMMDPKKIELSVYNKIERHYLAKLPNVEDAVITNTKKAVNTLNSLCVEMDMRYNLLNDAQVKGIKEYNVKFISRKLNPNEGHRYLSYIVLVVDEIVDFISTGGKEIELPIARLAQLARAVGIHLIIATSRPSVSIIKTVKANFPARVAFRVISKADSREILDRDGAERLNGKGDMLLFAENKLIRIRCAFADTLEIEKIVEFIGEQRGYPEAYALPECADESNDFRGSIFSADERDSMFDDAARLIVSTQSGSTSLIQRKLKLGYARSGILMNQLEDAGIVGISQGSKPREVYIKDMQTLENLLQEKD